jgi:type I restriction enzyme R subunit
MDDELVPYPERVRARYDDWLKAQEATGKTFTPEQRWWLDKIAEHVGVNLSITSDDFDYGEFSTKAARSRRARCLARSGRRCWTN